MDKIKEVKELLLNNLDLALEMARECNSWDGRFDFVDTYDIEELCNDCSDTYAVVRAVIYGDVNNVCDPVRYNGYGNLETVSDYDLQSEIKDYYIDEIVESIIDLYDSNHIRVDDKDLLDILDYEFDVEEEAEKVEEVAKEIYIESSIDLETISNLIKSLNFDYEDEEKEELIEYFKNKYA